MGVCVCVSFLRFRSVVDRRLIPTQVQIVCRIFPPGRQYELLAVDSKDGGSAVDLSTRSVKNGAADEAEVGELYLYPLRVSL